MLIISKEQCRALIDRLATGGRVEASLEELRRMVEIKSTLLWRADAACGCVGPGPASSLYAEVHLLERARDALEKGDVAGSISLLEDYLCITTQ